MFKLSPPASGHTVWKETVLYSFQGSNDGGIPQGALVEDFSGALYGTTSSGGAYGAGTIFKLTPPSPGSTAWTESVLYNFVVPSVVTKPVIDANGALYIGVDTAKHSGNELWKLTPPAQAQKAWVRTIIHEFPYDQYDGFKDLVADGSGAIYGAMSTNGRQLGNGVIFKLSPPAAGQTAWSYLVIHSNGATANSSPVALAVDVSGNLYGMTAFSPGNIFKLAPPPSGQTAWTYSSLYSFPATPVDYLSGGASLIISPSGTLYGTISSETTHSAGRAFMLSPPASGQTGWTETDLHEFGVGKDGVNPSGKLIIDSKGALYGMTQKGGHNGIADGTIFKLTPPAKGSTLWAENLLYSFQGNDGIQPNGTLIADADGNLYGTAAQGGAYGFGVVFKMTPPATATKPWTTTTIYSFTGEEDGSRPLAGVIADKSGALYGTTYAGGQNGYGTVFQLTPPGSGETAWTETVLHSFQYNESDGTGPAGALLADANGNFYGTTMNGGIYAYPPPTPGFGTVFKLNPPSIGQTTWTETVIYNFQGNADGSAPSGALIADAGGSLYGTTGGSVFMLTPPATGQTSWAETTLYSVATTANYPVGPSGSLIKDANGALYGVTQGSGAFYLGKVFKLTPPSFGQEYWVESDIYDFSTDGADPVGSLVADSSGALYGTTSSGGYFSDGMVFKLTAPATSGASWNFSVVYCFGRNNSVGNNEAGPDGAVPESTLLIDKTGALYGTTLLGGIVGSGTVFKVTQ